VRRDILDPIPFEARAGIRKKNRRFEDVLASDASRKDDNIDAPKLDFKTHDMIDGGKQLRLLATVLRQGLG